MNPPDAETLARNMAMQIYPDIAPPLDPSRLKVRERLTGIILAAFSPLLAAKDAEIARWRDSNIRLRDEVEHQSKLAIELGWDRDTLRAEVAMDVRTKALSRLYCAECATIGKEFSAALQMELEDAMKQADAAIRNPTEMSENDSVQSRHNALISLAAEIEEFFQIKCDEKGEDQLLAILSGNLRP